SSRPPPIRSRPTRTSGAPPGPSRTRLPTEAGTPAPRAGDRPRAADHAAVRLAHPRSPRPETPLTTAALTPEMAALGIAIGLFFSLLCYLTTNLSPGGMITPGWIALTLIE